MTATRCSQAVDRVLKGLARTIACFLADPHLAARKTETLHALVSASSRLLCDARRIRDGAFPPRGPNIPDEYYRQMAVSVYPSGCVMSLSEYLKTQKEAVEHAQVATSSGPTLTAKRRADGASVADAESPTKRPTIAAVRPATPYPRREAPAPPPCPRPAAASAAAEAGGSQAKIVLDLNDSR